MKVPSSISAPSEGILNSYTSLHQIARGGHDAIHLWDGGVLQVLGVGDRNFGAAYPGDGRIQLVERLLHDARRELRRQAAALPAFVHDQRAMRLRNRGDDGRV